MSATAEQWKPFTSMQRVVTASAGSSSGFIWDAKIAMLPGIKIHVVDSYIAGKVDLARLSFFERMAVKLVKSPVGDKRDWDRIRQWANGLGEKLQ